MQESKMLELYHNALSTCSQKVRFALAEKEVEFKSHEINLVTGQQHDPDYVRLNPRHVVPTLVSDGIVVRESSIINEFIEDSYATPALLPSAPGDRAGVRLWVKRVDDELHGKTTGTFTHAVLTRSVVLSQPAEAQEAYLSAIPDQDEQALRRDLFALGVAAPQFGDAVKRMASFLDDMESALANGPWLSGGVFSLADISIVPYIERMDSVGMSAMWKTGKRPNIERWLADIRGRPAHTKAIGDWVPAAMAKSLSNIGRAVAPEITEIIRLRDVR